MTNIKDRFPIFANNPNLVYLDNAATTQKPDQVIQSIVDFYTLTNANVHRGIYPLSENATDLYELARAKVAKFLNAKPEEIIFTQGATAALNGLVTSLVKSELLSKSPKILLNEAEHHSNILPWQQIKGAHIEYLSLNEEYGVDLNDLGKKKPDIIALTHASNTTGNITNLEQISKSTNPCIIALDAAQSVAHIPIDVKKLGVDFLVFSGHKIYGPTGIGVLYGKKELLKKMEPFQVGGGMISEVKKDSTTWAEIPGKFEAGTPPIAQAIGLASAVDFITEVGWEKIQRHEQKLAKYTSMRLQEIPGLKLFHSRDLKNSLGVFSFTLENIHPHDLSQFLSYHGIAARAGHHCAQILHREVLNVPATTRISLAIYNDEGDIDRLIRGIKDVMKILGGRKQN